MENRAKFLLIRLLNLNDGMGSTSYEALRIIVRSTLLIGSEALHPENMI